MTPTKISNHDELSPQFHIDTLKKIINNEVRIPLWICVLFILNLIISGWHLIIKSIEKDTLTFVKVVIQEFDLSYDFFNDVIHEAFEYMPLNWLIVFGINAILLFVFWRFSRNMKHMFNHT